MREVVYLLDIFWSNMTEIDRIYEMKTFELKLIQNWNMFWAGLQETELGPLICWLLVFSFGMANSGGRSMFHTERQELSQASKSGIHSISFCI